MGVVIVVGYWERILVFLKKKTEAYSIFFWANFVFSSIKISMSEVLGQAISDYFQGDRRSKLWVHDHLGPRVEMDRSVYFRQWKQMPRLEQIALRRCAGKVLDVGAGAGAHSLELQKMGLEVTAMDISALNVRVMQARGVQQSVRADFFDFSLATFDTILLMMNGIGICGKLSGLNRFLAQCKLLLNSGGQVLLDSSDLHYLYDDELPMPTDRYYGEIDCKYVYKNLQTEIFTWLYLDFETLQGICMQQNWHCEKIFEDQDNSFLVSLKPL